jgi:hypothetical protein
VPPGWLRQRKALRHHQHIEQDHRRQAQDHRPDPDCPDNIFNCKTLSVDDKVLVSIVHNAPALLVVMGPVIRESF